MVEITAARELRYGGQTRHAGDKFEATERDARTLVAIGRATFGPKPNPTDLPPAAVEVETDFEFVAAEPVVEPEAEEDTGPLAPPRRRYQRRDMQSEE